MTATATAMSQRAGARIRDVSFVFCFSCASLGIVVAFAVLLGTISSYNGEDHLVDTAPSYEEAAVLGGFYDDGGQYQGGVPKWEDWSEGSFNCTLPSPSAAYCQEWTTSRYYSDPDQEFLIGNCTCNEPQNGDMMSSLAWQHYESFSRATTEEAEFCIAWQCDETRYSKVCNRPNATVYKYGYHFCLCVRLERDGEECECSEYESSTNCRTVNGRRKCTTSQVCVSTSCRFVENDFYTFCDCDHDSEKARARPDWWENLTYCEDWRCYQGTNKFEAWVADASSGSSSSATNATGSSGNATVTSKYFIDVDDVLDYSCSQVDESALWCKEWRGISAEGGDVTEQLCACADLKDTSGNITTNSSTLNEATENFCSEWVCTTYYMQQCNVCNLVGGILLSGAILFCMVPVVALGCKGHCRLSTCGVSLGLPASVLLAVYMGGVAAVFGGVLPSAIMAFVLGGLVARFAMPSRVVPDEGVRDDVKGTQANSFPTPEQTPKNDYGTQPVLNYGQAGPVTYPPQQQQMVVAPGSVGVPYGASTASYGGQLGLPQMHYTQGGMPAPQNPQQQMYYHRQQPDYGQTPAGTTYSDGQSAQQQSMSGGMVPDGGFQQQTPAPHLMSNIYNSHLQQPMSVGMPHQVQQHSFGQPQPRDGYNSPPGYGFGSPPGVQFAAGNSGAYHPRVDVGGGGVSHGPYQTHSGEGAGVHTHQDGNMGGYVHGPGGPPRGPQLYAPSVVYGSPTYNGSTGR